MLCQREEQSSSPFRCLISTDENYLKNLSNQTSQRWYDIDKKAIRFQWYEICLSNFLQHYSILSCARSSSSQALTLRSMKRTYKPTHHIATLDHHFHVTAWAHILCKHHSPYLTIYHTPRPKRSKTSVCLDKRYRSVWKKLYNKLYITIYKTIINLKTWLCICLLNSTENT